MTDKNTHPVSGQKPRGAAALGAPVRLSILPLSGAILFPNMHLPLHIFEPRYRALVSDALARDRRIAVIQPKGEGNPRALYDIGCVGHIRDVEKLADGEFNIVLEGEARFQLLRELEVRTPFRQVEGRLIAEEDEDVLAAVERAGFEQEARRFAELQGYEVDWDALDRLDDATLIDGVSQIAPFDSAAKQALLEAPTLSARCETLIQLMQFFSHHDSDDGEIRATMQ